MMSNRKKPLAPRRDRGNGDEGDPAGPLPAARMRAAQAFLSVVETKVTSMFTQPLPWPASLRVLHCSSSSRSRRRR